MLISAVICTYKRADYLRVSLRSACQQSLPRDQFEVIVVDNAVDIEAERVVNESAAEFNNVRYVAEPKVGLSQARNTATKEARGKYIVYLDDDARADEHWLEALVNTFENASPAPSAIGGRVWLDWEGEKPAWVPNAQLSLFTFVDHGDEGHSLRSDEYLVGANLAFNRELLDSIGGFSTNLGRKGSVLLSGEEAQVLQEFRARGLNIYYEPAAVVWHSVHPSRKRPTWLLRRMFWDGASQPHLDRSGGLSRRRVLSGVLSDLRQCASWLTSAVTAMLVGKRNRAFESLLGLSQRAGRVRTQLRMLGASSN